MQPDTESLVDKVRRLMDSHNTLVTQVQYNAGRINLILDAIGLVLEDEIDDFKTKLIKKTFILRVEATLKARLSANAIGDLTAFAKFGKNLETLKAESKEMGWQSLYNKTIRRMEKSVEANKHGEIKADISFKDLINMPDMQAPVEDNES